MCFTYINITVTINAATLHLNGQPSSHSYPASPWLNWLSVTAHYLWSKGRDYIISPCFIETQVMEATVVVIYLWPPGHFDFSPEWQKNLSANIDVSMEFSCAQHKLYLNIQIQDIFRRNNSQTWTILYDQFWPIVIFPFGWNNRNTMRCGTPKQNKTNEI